MSIFRTVQASQIIFVLGIINLLTGLTLVSSCRWFPLARITSKIAKNQTYKSFFKYHSYIWWIFWTSVIIHVIFAVGQLGIPF
jgi:cytochrome b561